VVREELASPSVIVVGDVLKGMASVDLKASNFLQG
jgi:hypothetical protein